RDFQEVIGLNRFGPLRKSDVSRSRFQESIRRPDNSQEGEEHYPLQARSDNSRFQEHESPPPSPTLSWFVLPRGEESRGYGLALARGVLTRSCQRPNWFRDLKGTDTLLVSFSPGDATLGFAQIQCRRPWKRHSEIWFAAALHGAA